jgi:hypothetical protein
VPPPLILLFLHLSTSKLALLALVFSVTSNGINFVKLVKGVMAARVRRLEKKLGIHALPPQPEDWTITPADIVEIRVRPEALRPAQTASAAQTAPARHGRGRLWRRARSRP